MEKTTVIAVESFTAAFKRVTIVSTDVVAGRGRSTAEMSSSMFFDRAGTLASEHTANAFNGTAACAVHSRRVCDNREIDGTRTAPSRLRRRSSQPA